MPNVLRGYKREGEIKLRSAGGIPVIEEVYTFLVDAENKDVSRFEVFNSTPNIPVPTVTVSSYGITICKDVSLSRDESIATLWHGTANFSSEVEENQSGSEKGGGNPEAWVPVYETKFERLQEILAKDASDVAIANSAGQPFESGIIRARFIPVWEFFQIESASVTDEQIVDRNETVNSAVFKGRAAKTLLCTVLSSVLGFYYGSPRRLTQYSLKYNKTDWRLKRADVGTVYKDGATFKSYLDSDGNVMLGSLNGSGAKATVGNPPTMLNFDQFATSNFSTFLRT